MLKIKLKDNSELEVEEGLNGKYIKKNIILKGMKQKKIMQK